MGRPLNKRNFGEGSGNQIKVIAHVNGSAQAGFIVRQRSTRKFLVNANGNLAVCTLVNKNAGELVANEMIVNVLTDANVFVQVTKLYNRVAIVEGNQKVRWVYTASLSDGAVQVGEVDAGPLATIAISAQPSALTVTAGDSAAFTVTASGVGDLTYQWKKSATLNGTYTNVSGATAVTLSIADTVAADAGYYKVLVGSASEAATSVLSSAARLIVNAIPG